MINLSGYSKKILFLFSSTLLFLSIFSNSSFADTSLKRSSESSFSFDDEGNLSSKYEFIISKNTQVPSVITEFTFVIPFERYDSLKVSLNNREYKYTTNTFEGGTRINLTLPTIIVDRNNPLKISSNLVIKNHVVVSGENKHIIIPPIPSFISSLVEIKYPSNWGKIVWSSSEWTEDSESSQIKKLVQKKDGENGNPSISIVLGNSLGYDFEIKKLLENNSEQNTVLKISLPREGDGQHIIYKSFEPKPFEIEVDKLSNINVSYLLKPSEKKELNISGYIYFDKVDYASPSSFDQYLSIDSYWVFSNDSEIKRVKVFLQNEGMQESFDSIETSAERTEYIEKVYEYVLNRFSPLDLDSSITGLRRGMGKLQEITEVGASPDDYTDFLIALLKNLNVPARMVVGYIPTLNAYNSEGFFHSWVEYWNIDTSEWVQLDPALEDYFPTRYVDTRNDHITMIVRGESSLTPQVSRFAPMEFSMVPAVNSLSSITEVDADFNVVSGDDLRTKGDLVIENRGNRIIKVISVDLKSLNSTYPSENLWQTHTILPSETVSVSTSFPLKITDPKSIVVVTFEDLEGRVFKKSITEITDTSWDNDNLLINIAISTIIFVLAYMLLGKFLKPKRKNGK